MVLAQRRWLCDELASRGLQANSIIVADDDNLDIADEYGFPTVELDNSDLGERFNASYRYAAAQGADILVHIGSDDWVHPDAFDILAREDITKDEPMPDPAPGKPVVWRKGPQIVAQRRLTLVDMNTGLGRGCFVHGRFGCIPWLIPRVMFEPFDFAPIPPGHMRGIDGALIRAFHPRPIFRFQDDATDNWCVDFKTSVNVTQYESIADTLGIEDEQEPWERLARSYPADLVAMARSLAQ